MVTKFVLGGLSGGMLVAIMLVAKFHKLINCKD